VDEKLTKTIYMLGEKKKKNSVSAIGDEILGTKRKSTGVF